MSVNNILQNNQTALQGVPLYTAAQVGEFDRQAIDQHNNAYELMEKAGEATFMALLSQWPSVRQLLVLCGSGNNGGDGYVVARLAAAHEIEVQLIATSPMESLTGQAKQAAEDAMGAGILPVSISDIEWAEPADGCVIIDALLGTGLQNNVQGPLAQLIESVNQSGLPVLAIDVPSGIHASTGALQGVAIKAKTTICMIAYKQGLFTGMGALHAGQVRLADLSVAKNILQSQVPTSHLLNWQYLQKSAFFKRRTLDAHKGHFGHVLIVGGDLGYGGAVSLAAGAALKSGAGLVSVATRPEHVAAILARYPEAMVHAVQSGQDLMPLLERADVLVVGPGLGQSYWGEQLLQQVMSVQTPLLLDADALNILAKGRIKHNLSERISVMTPHVGEASRLLMTDGMKEGQQDVDSVSQDRFTAAQNISEKFASTVVLKGLGSLIQTDAQTSICSDGNPGMASGGMGDVLSGIAGSLMAQQVSNLQTQLHEVVCAAVCLHSAAADEAAKKGQVGLLASDVVKRVRSLLK